MKLLLTQVEFRNQIVISLVWVNLFLLNHKKDYPGFNEDRYNRFMSNISEKDNITKEDFHETHSVIVEKTDFKRARVGDRVMIEGYLFNIPMELNGIRIGHLKL